MKKLLLTMLLAIVGLITASAQTTSRQTVTFDFTNATEIESYGIILPATSSTGTDLSNGKTIVKNEVTFTHITNGSTSTRLWNNGGAYELRLYKGCNFSISVSSSSKITKIIIDGNPVNISANLGTWNSKNKTWSSAEGEQEVKFTVDNKKGTNTQKYNKITVTYEGGSTPPTPTTVAAPTFDPVAGTYDTPQTVTISSATQDATLNYSITYKDGSPVKDVIDATNPATETVDKSCTIEAWASLNGANSDRVKANYTINSTPTPPTPTEGTVFTKVTDPSQLVAGNEYIFVSEFSGKYFVMGQKHNTKNYMLPVEITNVQGNSVTIKKTDNVKILTLGLKNSKYSFYDGTDYLNSASNGLTLTSTPTYADVNLNSDLHAEVKFDPKDGFVQYNSGAPRFACYTSTQNPIYIYKAEGAPKPSVAEPVFSPVDTDYDSSVTQNIGVELSCATQGAKVYYTTDGNDPVVPGATEYTAPINVSTTTTIKAISVLYDAQGVELNRSAVVTETYTFTDKSKVELPVIAVNPEAGPYTTAKLPTVTLSCPTKDAPIYYTTDGTKPAKATANLYKTPIKITKSCTLKVIALSPNETESAVVEQAFVINPQAPTITPKGGTFFEAEFPISVTITPEKADAGAKILYSVDGSEPSSEYTAPIEVSAGQTVNAVAVNGTDKSEKSTATFTSKPNITVATPTFSTNGGSFEGSTEVTISTTTTDAVITYTINYTDGTTPAETIEGKSNSVKVTVDKSCKITAVAKVPYGDGTKSFESNLVTSAQFTITKPAGYTYSLVTNASQLVAGEKYIIICKQKTDYIAVGGHNGKYRDPVNLTGVVTLGNDITITANDFKTISEFTLGGVENAWTFYDIKGKGYLSSSNEKSLYLKDVSDANIKTTISIDNTSYDSNIKFKGGNLCYNSQSPRFTTYSSILNPIQLYKKASSVETPVFSLAAGTYTSVQNVTISSPANTTIEYWSDIAPDHITSTTNSVEVTVDKSCTIFAMTVQGQEKSSQVSAKYIIDIPVAAPVITPNGGYIANNEKVTITCETQDAVIYYTTDGTDPKEIEANKYPVGGFVLDKDCTVKAIAVIPGLAKSQITTSEPFKLYDPAVAVKPVITLSPESPNNTYRQGQLPITVTIGGDIPSKSRIYFSFDNFETSPRNYTAPFTIDESCTIIAKTISPDGSAETLSDPVTITVKPYEGIIYSLVTDAAQLEDGAKYIVVSKKGAQHYAMSSITKQNEREASPIPAPDVNNEIILSQMESLSAENVTLKANTKGSGWGFITKEGYYLCNADPNEDWLNVTVQETYLDVTFDGTDSKSVINVGNGRTLQFVSNEAGDPYFTCHSLPQTPVYLYRLDPMSVRHISEPVFEPDGGEFQNTVNVTMTSATSDASIFYSLDGGKTEYRLYPDGGIDLTANCEITAFAETSDGTRSKKVTSKPFLIYNPEVAVTPVIKLSKVSTDKVYCAFNIKDFPMKATIEGVPSNAEVYYSIDNGQEILYKHTVEAKDTLTISGPCTIKAYSKAVSGTGVSATTELVIKLKLVAPEITTVAGAGNYKPDDDIVYSEDTPQFEITNKDLDNSDVKIYYSLDGTTPSILYNAPVELTKTCIVRAIAKKEGFPDSDFDEMRFTVKKVKPKVRGSYMVDEFYEAYENNDFTAAPNTNSLNNATKIKMLQELYVVYSYRDIRTGKGNKKTVNSYIYVCDDSYYNNYANQVTVADGGFDDVHAIETGLVLLIFKQGVDLGEFHNGDVIKEGLNAIVAQYQGMPQITVANASDITVKRRSVRTIWPITRNISQLQAHKNFRRNMCYYVGINNCYDLKEVDMAPTMRLYDITDGTGNLKVHDKFYFIKNNPALSPNKKDDKVETVRLPRAMEGILTVYDLIADKREMHIIKFQDTPTGIEGVDGENTDITIIAHDGAIDITAPFDTDMMIFNAAGGVVINQQIPEGDTSLPMEPGFYIVKVGQKVEKVIVR